MVVNLWHAEPALWARAPLPQPSSITFLCHISRHCLQGTKVCETKKKFTQSIEKKRKRSREIGID